MSATDTLIDVLRQGTPEAQAVLKAKQEAEIAQAQDIKASSLLDLAKQQTSLSDYTTTKQQVDQSIGSTTPTDVSSSSQSTPQPSQNPLAAAVNTNLLAGQVGGKAGAGMVAAQQGTAPPPTSISSIATQGQQPTPEGPQREQSTAPIATSPGGAITPSPALIKAATSPGASPSLQGVAAIAQQGTTPVSLATGEVVPSTVELRQLGSVVAQAEAKADESAKKASIYPLQFGAEAKRDADAVMLAKQNALDAHNKQMNGTYQVMAQAMKGLEDGNKPEEVIKGMQTLGKMQLMHEMLNDPKNANRALKDVEAEAEARIKANAPPTNPTSLRMWLANNMALLKTNSDTIGLQKEIVEQQHVHAQAIQALDTGKKMLAEANKFNAESQKYKLDVAEIKKGNKSFSNLNAATKEADGYIEHLQTNQVKNKQAVSDALDTQAEFDLTHAKPRWGGKDDFAEARAAQAKAVDLAKQNVLDADTKIEKLAGDRDKLASMMLNMTIPPEDKEGKKGVVPSPKAETSSYGTPTAKSEGRTVPDMVKQLRADHPDTSAGKSDDELVAALTKAGYITSEKEQTKDPVSKVEEPKKEIPKSRTTRGNQYRVEELPPTRGNPQGGFKVDGLGVFKTEKEAYEAIEQASK